MKILQDPQLVMLSGEKFNLFKITVHQSDNDMDMRDEEIAMTVIIGDKPWIAVNADSWDNLDDDERQIVLAHEGAHATGVEAEEDADRWALDILNDKQKNMLIDMWEVRHGKTFNSNS